MSQVAGQPELYIETQFPKGKKEEEVEEEEEEKERKKESDKTLHFESYLYGPSVKILRICF